MADTVRFGKVVALRYEAIDPSTGEVVDGSGHAVMAYLHGADNIVDGLEEALEGREVGTDFDVLVPPEKAYGVREDGWPQAVPREQLQGLDDLRPGQAFHHVYDVDSTLMMWVTEVAGDQVMIDIHHPMAGKELRFRGTIVGLRDATLEELARGHVVRHADDAH